MRATILLALCLCTSAEYALNEADIDWTPNAEWESEADEFERELTDTGSSYDSGSYGDGSYTDAPTKAPTNAPTAAGIKGKMTFTGYTTTTFDATAQTAFKNTLATTLGAGVSASDITITDITAAARRRLSTSRRLSAGIDIKYTVAVADEAAAEAAIAKIQEVKADPSTFVTSFSAEVVNVDSSATVPAGLAVTVAEPEETGHDGHDHGGGGGGVNPASKASASALVSAVALAISCAMLS